MSDGAVDYSKFAEDPQDQSVSPGALERLSGFISRQKTLEVEIEEAELKIKEKSEELRRLAEVDIPGVMDETGLSEIRLADGTKVVVRTDYRVTTTGKYRDAVIGFLEQNGHGDLVKDEVVARFSKGESPLADRLLDLISENKLTDAVDRRRSVAPQSFQALVKELISSGGDVPLEELGIYVIRRASLKNK